MKQLASVLPIRVLVLPVLLVAIAGCSRSSDADKANTPSAQSGEVTGADALVIVRGTVVSVSPNEVVLKTDTSSTSVKLEEPLRMYESGPSDMAQVKESSFIGVTTVKQPDGSERATEIHVFPEELRGVGEGSRMMAQTTGPAGSRMTNGSVAPSRMTNGSATHAEGSSLVVQYAGGSQNVTVPPNTPVTELKASSKTLAAGDQAVLLANKAPGGGLVAHKAIFSGK
ncbi:MAG TPA: hypothetical protein VK636_08995 [Gemmatimonadaceae bacterium]|nr:hypothetical protein [Gemmatimonadaceae bacterium]